MSNRDDHMAAASVRIPNTIPEVPLPSNNNFDTVSGWARGVLDSFGLGHWGFGFDRARTRFGCCQHRTLTVTLSIHFVRLNGPAEIRETLLHEVAHALVGRGHGHDATWKAMARRVGARPTRCGNADMPEGRWRADCPSCTRKFSRHKRPKRLTGWHCRACGRDRGKLTWRMEA